MGTQQHTRPGQVSEVGVRDSREALALQTLHLVAVVDYIAQTI